SVGFIIFDPFRRARLGRLRARRRCRDDVDRSARGRSGRNILEGYNRWWRRRRGCFIQGGTRWLQKAEDRTQVGVIRSVRTQRVANGVIKTSLPLRLAGQRCVCTAASIRALAGYNVVEKGAVKPGFAVRRV